MNIQDFYTGHAFDAYEFFGAHTYFGGTHFAVWAPSAQHIAVETEIGTFDLHRTQSAVWECDAPGVQAGMVYQYWVRGANGQSVAHCDPYGTAMTLRPDGRSIVSDAPKGFADDKWMQERTKCFDKPLNIYEVHAGSWRQKEDGSWYTYAELAEQYGATVTGVDDLNQTFELLLSGRIDATLNAEMTFYDYTKEHPDANVKIAVLTDDANQIAIPMRKGDETATLRTAIDAAIDELRADGTIGCGGRLVGGGAGAHPQQQKIGRCQYRQQDGKHSAAPYLAEFSKKQAHLPSPSPNTFR